jgi:hypothetical protein
MKSIVITQLEIEGFHHYPNAPQQVEFLSFNHRHSFRVISGYQVSDLNREKEIFLCRDEVREYLHESYGYPCEFNAMSCEMIAKEILDFSLEDGMIWCEVWEEHTGGARIER